MSLIPLEVLNDLSAHFKTAPGGGLDCRSFVELMLTLLPIHNFDDQDAETNRLLRTLQEVSYAIGIMRLFSDIDINGDQTLEWDELTQYLVDTVLAQSGKDNIDNTDHKPQEAGLDREHLLKMELLETAPKMYRVSPSSQQPVCQKKIVLAEFWDKTVAVLEDLSDRLRLFSPNLEGQSEFCAGFRIFAAAVDHQSHLLCCLTSEPSLLFFDLAQQDFPRVYRQRLAVLHSQLFHLPEHKAWGVAQSNSKVLFGELVGQPPLETRRWETLATVHTHSDRLTGLVEASSADWFATSSLDGTIKIWSMIENKLISKINEEEELYGGKHIQTGSAYGVAGIDHCKQDPSFLLSWGFHSQVLIWQPIMSPTHPLIRKYSGHVGIVNSAKFLLHSKAAASLDNRGTLKIWDYLTGDTFQSLPLLESNLLKTLSSFVILGLEHSTYPDSIVIGGKHLLKIENPSLSSQMALIKDSQPLSLVYVTHFEGVLILTSSNLKAIRAEDSEVLFSLQLTKKAVSMIEGARGRKVYVAHEDGTIELLNAQNGKVLKTVCHIKEKECQAIKHAQLTLTKMAATSEDDRAPGAVLYLPDERILVVALHSVVYLFDESDSMDSNLLKFFLGGHDDAPVHALAYSRTNGILASGSTNGIVSLWMLYLNVHISSFFVKEPVKHLCCIDPFNALAVLTCTGKLSFWEIKVPSLNMKITPGSVPSPVCLGVFDLQMSVTCSTHHLELPSTYEFSMLLKSSPTEAIREDLGDSFTKSRDAFLADRNNKFSLLVVGDDHGRVSCFELNPFLVWKALKPQPLHPCKTLKESRLMRGEHLAAHKSVVLSLGLNINLSNFTDKLPQPNAIMYSPSKTCHFSTRVHKGRVAGVVYPPGTRYHLTLGADDKMLKAVTTSGLEVAARSVVLNSSKGSTWRLDLNMKYKTASEVTDAYHLVQDIKTSAQRLENPVVRAFMHYFQNGGVNRQETYINRSSIRLKNSVLSRQQNQHERMLLDKYNEEIRKSDTVAGKLPSTFLTQVITESTSLSSRFRRRESSKGKRFFDLVQSAMNADATDSKSSYRKSRIMSHLSNHMDQNLSESKFNRKSLLETQQLTSVTKDTDIKQRLMQLFNKGDDGALGKGKRGGISGGILNKLQQKARGGFAIRLNNAATPDKPTATLAAPAPPYGTTTQMPKGFRVSFAKLPGETARRHHMQTSSVGSLRLTLRDSESGDKSKESSPKRASGNVSRRGWKGASVLSQNIASSTAGIELFRARVEKVLGEKEREKIEFELNLKPSIGDFGTDNPADAPRNLKERIFALLDSKRPDGGERSPSKRDTSPNRPKKPTASGFSDTFFKLEGSATGPRGANFTKKHNADESSSDVHLTNKAPTAKYEVSLNKQSLAASQKLLVAHEQFMQSLVTEYRSVDAKSQLPAGVHRSGSAPRSFPHSKVIKHAVLFK